VNGTVAPLDIVNDPWAVEPTTPPTTPAAIAQVCPTDPPPAVTAAAVRVPLVATPAIWTLHAVGVAFEDPVFWRFTMQVAGAALVQVTETAETCAELVNDPNRPNTNPAMAIAAMSVIAMRMTVASTGEMAFLFFL